MNRSVVAVMAFLVACSTPSDGPPSVSPTETHSSEGTPTVSLTPGWNVSDGKVTTRDDLAYWIVSYDAAWTGEGDPPEEKCVFKVRNQEGVVVRQTGEVLEEGNDVEAETIYPDEVPGQPRTVSIECKSG